MQRRRLVTLLTAALVAAGFVVLRVVYRIVFGGGAGDGVLLLDLPRVPLAGPFATISLFGPLTTGGIANAALGALPFAAVILAVGLLAAVFDLRALLTRGAVRGPVRTVSRALVVAWSTFPALRASVLRVQLARRLRAERSPASLLVPVLEQTIERAIALGASMEVRGFAATRQPEPVCERPAVLRDAALGYGDSEILRVAELDLVPGTLTLVTGRTGAGKSTLLHALSGVFQHQLAGWQTGTITVAGIDRLVAPPRDTAGFVGVVSQSVRASFVAQTVADELGFALAVRGVAATIVAARVGEVAEELAITHLLTRETVALSAGEACLVAIGAALIARPVLLLIDEPLADLDEAARGRVVGILERISHRAGVCVLVAEHATAPWSGVADARLEVRGGELHHLSADELDAAPAAGSRPARERRGQVAQIRRLSVRHGQQLAVDGAELALAAGELVALTGPNGAGKSSLLQAMALPNRRETVIVNGVDAQRQRPAARRASVALVPEACDDLLFATSVGAECRRADRVAGFSGTAEVFLRFIGDSAGGAVTRPVLDRHPRDLSAGERLCLVIAIQLSSRPAVLLVDEPTRGLDAAARALVGEALNRVAADGSAVVFATHDREFSARYADRVIEMAGGRLESAARQGVS